ncbi:LOW QUALITY PROTEIN: glucocorticoid modulatory element-binding protein 1-like [Xenentodon cancila]
MAGAEVTVSSGQLMKVKGRGECSGNNHTTQVILHLHGINYETADSGAPVLVIGTPQNKGAKGEEVEYGYPITCGNSRAVLLFKKFVCPGINVRCVKFNDQLISPKQFVHLAGKATLKDWKRAIRLGGVMLRKMMDSGQIDFYQHDSVCNNTCRSTKFDVQINNTRAPPGTLMQPGLSCLALDPVGGQVPPLTGRDVHLEEVEGTLKDKFSATAERSDGPLQHVKATTTNGLCAKRKRVDMADGVLGLWRAVADSGLMGTVLCSLQTELLTTFKGVEHRSEKASLQKTDALILHSLCEMFGLLDSVKQAVDMRRSQTDESKTQNSVYVLDDIPEGQRKQSSNKNRSDKISSQEHVGYQHHSQMTSCNQNQLSSTVIRPLSVSGYSASHAQLFTQFTADHRVRVRNGQSSTLDKEQRISKTGNQLGEEDTSGMHKNTGQRTVKLLQDSQIRSEELEAKNGTHIPQNSIVKRKPSEKRRSK